MQFGCHDVGLAEVILPADKAAVPLLFDKRSGKLRVFA